jgi:hypothetical protein
VFNTLGSLRLGAISLGSAVGGLLHRPMTAIAVFTAVNRGRDDRRPRRQDEIP